MKREFNMNVRTSYIVCRISRFDLLGIFPDATKYDVRYAIYGTSL